MADEDQERIEDYVALESYIEALQAGNVAHPPENLTLEQIHIYQMAALFSSATDEYAEPQPEFAEQLKARLLEAGAQQQAPQHEPASKVHPLPAESMEPSPATREISRPGRFFSRRGLLTGGVAAAATLVIGAGIGYEAEKNQQTQAPVTPPAPPDYNPGDKSQQLNISEGMPTTWHFVAMLADLGNNAVRFTSDSVVGYVIRAKNATNATNSADNVIALSASCTHMGCLLQWKNTEHQFNCPCHNAIFDDQGTQKPSGYPYQLSPLPRLNTKIEQGKVYVEVPS
ncbi:Rieske (2Fe-2S) protein [Ktedonobacteria bacterium brp13]|nr:Rieske (2Fe-2S) protein [Ktedonobacteria bacterium brp13]